MGIFRIAVSFSILATLKVISQLIFRFEYKWLGEVPHQWKDVHLGIFLNHTSLFEPLFIGCAPWGLLIELAKRTAIPGADITINRPIVGLFYRFLIPKMVSITRKRDESWEIFLKSLEDNDLVVIAAEGRMLRDTGLDKEGNPMSIRGGVADILKNIHGGKMLIFYSGGLHHVHHPGDKFFRPFQTIKMNAEYIDIDQYKSQFSSEVKAFKVEVVKDLEVRKSKNIP